MSTPKVSLSPDDATGLVHVKAEWTFDPNDFAGLSPRIIQAQMVSKAMIRELAVLLAMLDGETPTEKVSK